MSFDRARKFERILNESEAPKVCSRSTPLTEMSVLNGLNRLYSLFIVTREPSFESPLLNQLYLPI